MNQPFTHCTHVGPIFFETSGYHLKLRPKHGFRPTKVFGQGFRDDLGGAQHRRCRPPWDNTYLPNRQNTWIYRVRARVQWGGSTRVEHLGCLGGGGVWGRKVCAGDQRSEAAQQHTLASGSVGSGKRPWVCSAPRTVGRTSALSTCGWLRSFLPSPPRKLPKHNTIT